jgi:acetyltransferase-like isoleucine patch superfamily enzyme
MTGEFTIIRDDVKIGKDSKVWHFCNLYGCKIGENTQVGSYTEIKEGAYVGNNCRIQARAFISEGTRIGNYVFIGPSVTFLNDKYPSARKAINKNWTLESVVVEDEVSIGGGVIIMPGVRIGRNSVIGAGSVVTKNIPEYSVVYGNPAKIMGNVKLERYKEFRK